jgi:hypothetical protein
MLLLNLTLVFESQLWQYAAILVFLYSVNWWADHTLSIRIHTQDTCPIESASIFSKVDFSWLSPLVSLAQKKTLDGNDLLPLPKSMSPETTLAKLQSNCGTENFVLPSFLTLLFGNFAKEIFLSFLFELLDILSKFLIPWVFKTFLETQRPSLIAVMLVLNVVNSIAKSQASYNVKVAGINFKACVVSGIGEKALRLSSASWSSGVSVINLVEVDTQKVQDYIVFINASWSAPLQLTVCLCSIGALLGWESALGAVASIVRKSFSYDSPFLTHSRSWYFLRWE